MTWTRYFCLLLLIPSLTYALLHQGECKSKFQHAEQEETRCLQCLSQSRALFETGETRMQWLNEALSCCSQAIADCDTILNDIAQLPHRKRHKSWRPEMKEACQKKKERLLTLLHRIQEGIDHAASQVVFEKAQSLYNASLKQASLAAIKIRSCPQRRPNNLEGVVFVLNATAALYEEAASIAREALALLGTLSSSREDDKATLTQDIEKYQQAADQYRQEALDWPAQAAAAQKTILKEQLETLRKDASLCLEQGLKRSAYEAHKQMLLVLEELIESSETDERESFQAEWSQLKNAIADFTTEMDLQRLTEVLPSLSLKDFKIKEEKRREVFFKRSCLPALFPQSLLEPYRSALPLDGQVAQHGHNFILYTHQFYRFLVQSDTPVSDLVIRVYSEGKEVHKEPVAIPQPGTPSWERFLTTEGMVFIPQLEVEYGLDLRLTRVRGENAACSIIISQKAEHSRYQFSLSFDQGPPLYHLHFSIPPPWQLDCLRKPALCSVDRLIGKTPFFGSPLAISAEQKQLGLVEPISYPLLDQLVEELKQDPLALTSYVYHEIALVDPCVSQSKNLFYPPCIYRNALRTYLEKKGSVWEQCQLLTYLLRKAGYPTFYVIDGISSIKKTLFEKLVLTQLPEEQTEALVSYPWVVFFNGETWISLFPWMKEFHSEEGYDLYSLMSPEYASADRWILQYLKRDEAILKHIDSDGDDTAGPLFIRFVEQAIRKQGISPTDVGIHRIPIKRQFSSWEDFPRPTYATQVRLLSSLCQHPHLFAKALLSFSSHENPQKTTSYHIRLADIGCSFLPIHFSKHGPDQHQLNLQWEGEERPLLILDATDRVIDLKITIENPLTDNASKFSRTLAFSKGTSAALCFHFGGAAPGLTSEFHKQFTSEKDEKKRLHALLGFVGASYFDRCGRSEEKLSALHKVHGTTLVACGLAKLSPDLSRGPFRGEEDLVLPQVDMHWYQQPPSTYLRGTAWRQDLRAAYQQCLALQLIDLSSNEHQILREVFQDEDAVSTVKLLQLAYREYQKTRGGSKETVSPSVALFSSPEGLDSSKECKQTHEPPTESFSVVTRSDLEEKSNKVEATQDGYVLDPIQRMWLYSPGQWSTIQQVLDPKDPLSLWAYAYVTPGWIANLRGSYREVGTCIIHPRYYGAFISNNNLVFNGGLGSPLPRHYLTPWAINKWQLTPTFSPSEMDRYFLECASPFSLSSFTRSPLLSVAKITRYSPDVRLGHKSWMDSVGDPVDVVTGAFYVDEVDLALSGPFPIEIRRNYNSQNPLMGDLGVGWKLSLNPYLIKQDEKLYAAESDGTLIAYSYNPATDRWEVLPADNPDLFNFRKEGVRSHTNPFHAYIEKEVLYGPDGSKRIFEEGLLRQWINAQGNTLTFFYHQNKLSRIESSNGDFCGFHYNHIGYISEIYARDGRRISYGYNSLGDLVKVTLPNTAVISYDYDHAHQIIRETKPQGKVLENRYVDGKVIEQRSPSGPGQAIISSATFDFQEGLTTVTDPQDKKTAYKIFQKQIYKIIDPLGYKTLQSWFIDEHSWFDPVTEQVVAQKESGSAARCLKSSTDKRGLTTYYLYDQRGNPVEIRLQGKDVTGDGHSLISKQCVYNERDLCVSEKILNQQSITTYDTTFPYLPKRIETYSADTLIAYRDFEYNAMGQIEKEDASGSITLWKYEGRGLPCQKTQLTGTEDPDVITTYVYNNQGQPVAIRSADSIQEHDYDIMGCPIESKTFSPSAHLISAVYRGYDLNSQPIWQQTANPQNTLYLDYNASGQVKASRQTLSSGQSVAYNLYEYDSRGDLIEEVDPLGYTTYRTYDALGRLASETKEGLSTCFTYEPGGLIESTISPSGAKSTRLYTTNGLLKEEIYPDSTTRAVVYDVLGRPIRETKQGITWKITYDDSRYRIQRTNTHTKSAEHYEFDLRGNLTCFTDAAGYTSTKTYDGLNRIKTEMSPSGELTLWSYEGNTVRCTLPNAEVRTQHYEAGRVVASEVVDSQGHLLAQVVYQQDPTTDVQTLTQGDEVTTTWVNTLRQPTQVQKGSLLTTYEYDVCGNCIAVTDGDGKTIRHTFDGLRRITQTQLPDGGLIGYVYDLDSNIAEYHLPNGTIWKASYDAMRRKIAEEVEADHHSSFLWRYTYEKGYLTQTQDPMQRMHTYLYDLNGRLAQETVDGWVRRFTYDHRGLLTSAEQMRESGAWFSSWFYSSRTEHSKVERSYDANGRLLSENIYLNAERIQQTSQTWDACGRSLHVDDHTRDFVYQNNRLIAVATGKIDLSYSYNLSGSLVRKSTPFSITTMGYNPSGFLANTHTQLPHQSCQEALEWYPSGKLAVYKTPEEHRQFTYTERGYLQSTAGEVYDFDFGSPGIGVRTAAPDRIVPQQGIDSFGKVVTEIQGGIPLTTLYDLMGQVVSQGSRQLEWDPWGRLLKIVDEAFTWEASYDVFGRRLQTRYMPLQGSPRVTTSLYDPEQEFQEMGVKYEDKTFWKIYGPNACDALSDETGEVIALIHNALNQLTGVISQKDIVYTEQLPSSYGPQSPASIPSDLLSYGKSLTWRSQFQDPTGLIWMGERYYDPQGGRFLSPDPVRYPTCLNPYAYASGDPINYMDPDGRFASPVYQPIPPNHFGVFSNIGNADIAIRLSRAVAYYAKNRSCYFQVGSVDPPHGAVGFINGINNRIEDSIANATVLSGYGKGVKIHGVYNATHSSPVDVLECICGMMGACSQPVPMLQATWNDFIATHPPEDKFLQISSSGGAIHVLNALKASPESVRQRIICVNLAPAVIIPDEMCYGSRNYTSKRDVVPHFDIAGRLRYGDELTILEPHAEAKWWDHECSSPTFQPVVEQHLNDHFRQFWRR